MPLFILIAKSGVTGTYNICYLANAQLFPAVFAGTAFGICNIGGKMATVLAPIVAELGHPVPMLTFASMSAMAATFSWFITPPKSV